MPHKSWYWGSEDIDGNFEVFLCHGNTQTFMTNAKNSLRIWRVFPPFRAKDEADALRIIEEQE